MFFLSLSLPPPAPHRWTYKLLQEDIVFCNRLEHSHLHFPWCRGGDWQGERKYTKPHRPCTARTPSLPAASLSAPTAAPPQAEQAPGTSLAPKTQLRHEGKERPVWRVALAPDTDAGASDGRAAKATKDPAHLTPPASPRGPGPVATSFSSWEGFSSSACPVAFWAFLHLSPQPPSASSLSNSWDFIY